MANIKVFKFPNSVLHEEKFNMDIEFDDAVKKGYVIGIGVCQVLKWIYAKNGIDVDTLTNKDKKHLFCNELVQVEFSGASDFDTINKRGLVINGKNYKYFNSKGTNIITYIQEDLHDEFMNRLNCGRNMSQKLYPSKLSAYMALTFTTSKPVTTPKNVIVIDDIHNRFESEYLYVTDTDVKLDNKIHDRNISDGCFFISPTLATTWSNDLGQQKVLSAFQVRFAWTKGIVVPVDFKRWCEAHDITYVTDCWGTQRNVLDADLILTTSMVKLWNSYSSMEDWLNNAYNNDYEWRVGKVSHELKAGYSNYQELLPMTLDETDVKQFIEYEITMLQNIQGGNYVSMYKYLNGDVSEDSLTKLFNSDDVKVNLATALMIDRRLQHDKFLVSKIKTQLEKTRKQMKKGHCLLGEDSSFQIIVCDVIALLEGLVGLPIQGFLKPYELYSKTHMIKGHDSALAFRTPSLIRNNTVKVKIAKPSKDVQDYLEYLDDIYLVDCNSLINENCCGFDFDGDSLQLSTNEILLSQHTNELPVVCAGVTGVEPTVVALDDLISNARIMVQGGNKKVPNIGSVINKFTQLYAVRGMFPKGSKEYEELTKRLMIGQCVSQSVIDAKKTSKWFPLQSHWFKLDDVELMPLEQQDFHTSICGSKKPYFMIYNYEKEHKKYNEWLKAVDVRTICHWNLSAEEFLELDFDSMTQEQQDFYNLVVDKCPINAKDRSTMYTFTKVVEKQLRELDAIKTTKVDSVGILRFEDVEFDGDYKQLVKDVKKRFKTYLLDCSTFNDKYEEDDDTKENNKQVFVKQLNSDFKKDLLKLCNNNDKLACNVLLEVTYSDGSKNALVWDLFGNLLIKNLLEKNNYEVNLVLQDDNGEYNYKYKNYSVKTINVKGVMDNE